MGEIKDEYDVETEPISLEGDGSVLVAGRVTVDRLEQALEATSRRRRGRGHRGRPRGHRSSATSRRPGEKIDFRGFTVEVVDAERKRVNRVRFRRSGGGGGMTPRRAPAARVPLGLRERGGPPQRRASPRSSTGWWARRWPSSRTSPRPRATASWPCATGPTARSSSSTRPGIHKPMHRMNERMVETAVKSVGQVDVVLWLADVTEELRPGRPLRGGRPARVGPARHPRPQQDRRCAHKKRLLPVIEQYRRLAGLRGDHPALGAARARTWTSWPSGCWPTCRRASRSTPRTS